MSTIELKGLQGLNLLIEGENKASSQEHLLFVDIVSVVPCPFQPRKIFNKDEINELAESIKSQGLIQPIIVRKSVLDKYEIVAGERRWRAAQVANLTKIPVICKSMDDATVLACALIENIQRKELNVVDEAYAIKTMIEKYAFTQEKIAHLLGKGRSTITNLLRILQLEPQVIKLITDELLELGHAKLLVGLENDHQISIANEIVNKHLSVRDAEKYITSHINSNNKVKITKNLDDSRVGQWQERLSKRLHSKVDIKLNANGKGKVIINLESLDEIEWIVKELERI